MSGAESPASAPLSIAAVERDTGLSKDTLRVWERRYGFPQPGRDGFGERVYGRDQVDKLRVLRRLMDFGHRPGRIVHLPLEELQRLSREHPGLDDPALEGAVPREELARLIALVRAHQVEALRTGLSQAVLRAGLERFVIDVCAPLNRMIGEAWARGELEIFEEHLYTESMQVVLRNAISSIPQPARRPHVLLTTFPGEGHGLGLLMAEAVLALDGCRCVSLGTETPVWDIALAASAQRADIVALSFSAALGAGQVVEGLVELRAKLAPGIEIWAGGGSPTLRRRPPPQVTVIPDLPAIHDQLGRWRAHAAAA